MSAFRYMMFFYAAMAGVPALLWLISVSYYLLPQAALLRWIFALLVGAGSIVFGVLGIREVFVHGR